MVLDVVWCGVWSGMCVVWGVVSLSEARTHAHTHTRSQGKHADSFARHEVDGRVLMRLTTDDLRAMGVSAFGHRIRLSK